MGYAHYWYLDVDVTDEELSSLKEDLYILIEDGYSRGVLGNGRGEIPMMSELISDTRISFNGINDHSHETFFFPLTKKCFRELMTVSPIMDGNKCFSFTKTAYKSYDIYVVMCLSVIKSKLGSKIKIFSDGRDDVFIDGYEKAMKIIESKSSNEKGIIKAAIAQKTTEKTDSSEMWSDLIDSGDSDE